VSLDAPSKINLICGIGAHETFDIALNVKKLCCLMLWKSFHICFFLMN